MRQQHDRLASVGVEFVVANTDAQGCPVEGERQIQLGEGLGAGAVPMSASRRRKIRWIRSWTGRQFPHGVHHRGMAAAPDGGARSSPSGARGGILCVGVVTKPFAFEGDKRMRAAERGITSCSSMCIP